MRRLIALLPAFVAACATPPDAPAPREIACPTRPNIVLVFADDLGYGELGCYGQPRIATPNIDRLAREGARFTQFYSAAPVCAPSRAALMTGLHLGHCPIRDNTEVQPEGQGPLPAEATTLADDLRRAGYATACIGKWGLGFVGTSGDPNANGFDLFFGYNCQRQAHNYYPTHLWRNGLKVSLEGNDPKTRAESIFAPDLMVAEARSFIAGAKDTPFFLAYTSILPHMAMQPKAADLAAYAGRFDETPYVGGKGYLPHPTPRAGYAAMISRLDAEVGAIRTALEEAGVADRTLIVITSDNGPTHDVGGVDTAFFDSTGGLRGRKGSVWEGGLRVPCVAWWPGHIAAGRTAEAPAWTVDLRATFASVAGVEAGATDGTDLTPLLLRGEAPAPRALRWTFPGYGGQQAVRDGDWKIVRRDLDKVAGNKAAGNKAAGNKAAGNTVAAEQAVSDKPAKTAQPVVPWQLFDLARDPKETTDLAAQYPEVVARLAALAEP